MCKLVIMKATMGAILVLISPVIFGSVMIDAVGNKCIFLDPNGEQITITNPDKIKVVQRGGNPARATCQDADEDVTSDGGRPIFLREVGKVLTIVPSMTVRNLRQRITNRKLTKMVRH